MQNEVSNEVNYEPIDYSHAKYSLSKISPVEGIQSRTIGPSGGDVLTFEIPANIAFNLSKSYLNLVLTGVSVASNANWRAVDVVSSIRDVILQTKGGIVLASFNYVDVFSKATMKSETKLDDFLSLDEVESASGGLNGLSRSDALPSASLRYDGTVSTLAYTEPKYLVSGTLAGTNPVIYERLPLNIILNNSIFSLDKDLMFGEILQLRVIMNSANRMSWYSTSATDPTAGTPTNAATITLTNPFLYLALEKNEDVNAGLREKINSPEGLNVLIDYVYPFRTSFSASTLQSTSIRLNRTNGSRLKKIFYCLTPATETTNGTFNISNINGAKITQFYDQLNNVRLIDYNVSCLTADAEDWMLMREYLKGSVVQSQNIFQYNWCFCRVFSDNVSALEKKQSSGSYHANYVQGLPLDSEVKYDFIATTVNSGFNHYSFAVCQKTLKISSSGIQLY